MNPFYRLACRTIHLGLKLVSPLLPYRAPERVGYDAAAEIISRHGRRVLLVTGKSVRAHGLCDPLIAALENAGLGVEVFDDVSADPSVACVERAAAFYRERGCDCIAAVGGGSPMDCAKGVCTRIASPKKPLRRMKGALKVRGKVPLLLAVPTTAGTGSEATAAAVFTDEERHEKFAVFSFKLVPHCYVLDPDLTRTLPPAATADTGMDALTHAVEAYLGRALTKKSKSLAESAVRRIFEFLPTAYADGQNMEARTQMAIAAEESGEAFTLSYVGYVHALAHAVGGVCGIPHGRACAVLLPNVLRAYGKKAEKKLARLSVLCGFCEKTTPQKAAALFLEKTEELLKTLGIPAFLPIEKSPMLARRAAKEAFLYPVPKLLGLPDLESILNSVTLNR